MIEGAEQQSGSTYDSGTITVKINGETATITYGQGSTPTSIATSLQTAIQNVDSSFLTDVRDDGVEILTSNSGGGTTDWSITASVNNNNHPLFPSPSFAAIATGMVDGTGARNGNGVLYGYVVPPGGYAPNGDIIAHSDSVTGDFGMIYDDLDRLIVAKAVSNVTAQSNYPGYFNCFAYDAYGNRLSEAMSTTGCQSSPPKDSWANYNAANNQMQSPNSMGAVQYDASGNMLKDGRNQYWYDAEGRVCASQLLGGGSAYQYVYDAEGARIAIGALSSVPSPATATCAMPFGSSFTTQYSYLVDQSGDQVTELDNSGYFLHSNIWIAGGLEATYDKTALHFNFEDPVGTKRAQGNVLGQLDETCVSLPFGNDTNDPYGADCTAASNGLHTGDDDGEIHFSQKERDTETGNDYFLARYYNSAWGRFITPDWSAKVQPVPYAAFTDPQSLNLYAYVRNSPLLHYDADGHGCNGWGCLDEAETEAAKQLDLTETQQKAQQAQQKTLPDSPAGLGDGWSDVTPSKRPAGQPRRYKGPKGTEIEFDPAKSGKPGWGGKNHWHEIDPATGKRVGDHLAPGVSMPGPDGVVEPEPAPEAPEPQTEPQSTMDSINNWLDDQWQGFKNYLRDHPWGQNSSPGNPYGPSPNSGSVPPPCCGPVYAIPW